MTMLEQHQLALDVLAWAGILALPMSYLAIFVVVWWTDQQEKE